MKGSMKKLVVFGVIAIIATFISAAMAKDSKTIHGVYAATSINSCIGSYYFPFGEDLKPTGPPSTVFNNTATSKAIWTFNRDGTGEVQARTVGINFSMNANSSDVLLKFTYEIMDDGMISIVWKSAVATYLTGPSPDTTYTLSGMVPEEGYVSSDHKTITLSSVEPGVITLTFNPPLGFPVYAICNYSRVLIRIGE